MEPTVTHEMWFADKVTHLWDERSGRVKFPDYWGRTGYTKGELVAMGFKVVEINVCLENK